MIWADIFFEVINILNHWNFLMVLELVVELINIIKWMNCCFFFFFIDTCIAITILFTLKKLRSAYYIIAHAAIWQVVYKWARTLQAVGKIFELGRPHSAPNVISLRTCLQIKCLCNQSKKNSEILAASVYSWI